jgi:type II secretion system protein G
MLARIRKAMDENEQGFTLIELLVVMIIIGILAAIAIPVFLNQRKNAVDASYKSDLRTVANEMESYYTDNEVYPATAPSNSGVAGALVTGIGSGSGVRVSKNTVISVTYNTAANAYCILASNSSGKGSHDWTYVSSQGGLQPAASTTCPAAGAF